MLSLDGATAIELRPWPASDITAEAAAVSESSSRQTVPCPDVRPQETNTKPMARFSCMAMSVQPVDGMATTLVHDTPELVERHRPVRVAA